MATGRQRESLDSTKHTEDAHESTPLLQSHKNKFRQQKWPKSVVYRLLLTVFLVSSSFGVTQASYVRSSPVLSLCPMDGTCINGAQTDLCFRPDDL